MLQRLITVLVVSVVVAAPAAAEGPAIEHQPLACVVAGRFPQLEARLAPAESVARARVQFQAEGTRHWYGVAMKPEGAVFSAVLPQPKKSLKSYRYYLEVTDTSLGSSRTPEYTTVVGASTGACADVKTAGGLASAAVKLEVPAGAPSVPGGFSASGVIAAGAAGAAVAAGATTAAAAGGGISTAVLVVGGVAVAGAGAAVAVTAGGGEGGSTAATYAGPFNGQTSLVLSTAVPQANGQTFVCGGTSSLAGTMTILLHDPSGPAVTGTLQTTGTSTPVSGECPPPIPLDYTVPISGSAGSLSARSESSMTSGGAAPGTITRVFAFAGALSGGVINGTLTITSASVGTPPNGLTFTGNTSVTMPVTLSQIR